MTEDTMRRLAAIDRHIGLALHFLADDQMTVINDGQMVLSADNARRARGQLKDAGLLLDRIGEDIEAGQP